MTMCSVRAHSSNRLEFPATPVSEFAYLKSPNMPHEKIVRARALRASLYAQLLNDDEFYLYDLMPSGESKKRLESSLWSNPDFRTWYVLAGFD